MDILLGIYYYLIHAQYIQRGISHVHNLNILIGDLLSHFHQILVSQLYQPKNVNHAFTALGKTTINSFCPIIVFTQPGIGAFI